MRGAQSSVVERLKLCAFCYPLDSLGIHLELQGFWFKAVSTATAMDLQSLLNQKQLPKKRPAADLVPTPKPMPKKRPAVPLVINSDDDDNYTTELLFV